MKNPIINDDNTMHLQALTYNGKEWMEVDDVINWLKLLKQNVDDKWHPLIHYQIKSVIKMKNYKK